MALKGRHLTVGADIWVPWVDLRRQENGSLTATGVAAAFFDIIANKLNFTYTLIMPEDREWGRGLPNGSFTGMIGMCQRKEVDMALGPFGVTWERAQVVEFSSTLYVDGFGIFLPRPRLEKNLMGFTNPLAWQVWVTLGSSFVFSLVLGILLNFLGTWRSSTPEGDAGGDRSSKVAHPLWIVQALLSVSIEKLPTRDSGRVFLCTWLLAGFILSSAYRGVLTSLLAVPMVSVPVDSLEDLVSYGRIPWANEKGTSLHQLFGDATSGLYKTIYDKGSLVINAYEARERIKEEQMAVLCDFFTMKKIVSDDFSKTGQCNYYIASEPIKGAPLAFAFPKNSSLVQHFDAWISSLVESGLVSRSVAALTSNATACQVPPGNEPGADRSVVFTLLDLAGVFMLLAGGLLMSLLILLIEMIGNKIL